jgi:regulator of protease activity HflC (stomatin/prohibitin superfamily)
VASTRAPGAAADAGEAAQLFQSVSADIRVLYRVGLDDRSAVASSTAAIDPARLLRADAAAVVGAAFAASTLPQVLGADRERLGAVLRAQLQQRLDQRAVGIEAVAVIVEAIHPPAGAADAYHAVRAAEISADAAIYAERGRALTVQAQTRQYAFGQTASATARAAEVTGTARSNLIRFGADLDASHHAGPAFLFERRLADLGAALARVPATIIDRHLAADAATLDLRPAASGNATTADGE